LLAYACVYRNYRPSAKERAHAENSAASKRLLRGFLTQYEEGYYDWGDAPGFFAAENPAIAEAVRRDKRERESTDQARRTSVKKPPALG